MKTIAFKKTIITVLSLITILFVGQLVLNIYGYISAANYIEEGNY